MATAFRISGYVSVCSIWVASYTGDATEVSMWALAITSLLGIGVANIIEEIRKGRS